MEPEPPPEDDDLVLHERLLAREPTVTNDLYDRHFRRLVGLLRAKYRLTDEELIMDAVTDALFGYFEHPEKFDPSRRRLKGYLFMSAEGDLRNLLERHRRRLDLESVTEDVELEALAGNQPYEDEFDRWLDEEEAAVLRGRIEELAQNDEELTVLRLMLDGEKSTAVYAKALGIAHLDPAKQRKQLFKIKDRLDKRIKRRMGKGDV